MDCSFKTVMTNLVSIVYKTKKTNDNTCIQRIIRFACIDIYIYIICKHTIINFVHSVIPKKGKTQ